MAQQNVHRVSHTRFLRNLRVKANAVIRKGEIVLTQDADGLAIPCAAVANCKGAGIADADVDATGLADGAKLIDVEQGVFLLDNHATNTITIADVGKKGTAFGEDANTVGNSAAGKSPVGVIVGLGYENLPGAQIRIES